MKEQNVDQDEGNTVHPLRFISTTKNNDLLRIRGYMIVTVEEAVQNPTLVGAKSFGMNQIGIRRSTTRSLRWLIRFTSKPFILPIVYTFHQLILS